MLTLICYISIRKQVNLPTLRQSALIGCLFVAALNSKEISVPLAGFVLAYEWLFPRPAAGEGDVNSGHGAREVAGDPPRDGHRDHTPSTHGAPDHKTL
jgi:hypothetical protein